MYYVLHIRVNFSLLDYIASQSAQFEFFFSTKPFFGEQPEMGCPVAVETFVDRGRIINRNISPAAGFMPLN